MYLYLFVPILMFLTGCTAQYEAIGGFDDHNEVFRGNVKHNLLTGTATITAKGEVTGMTCSGTSRVTEIPNPFAINCAGQRGIADLTCSDGRVLRVDWVAENCTRGRGTGRDQKGNTFTLVFGMNGKEAQAAFEREAKRAESKPDLPGIYDPDQTRAEKGYATGTGFFISPSGILVTNYHVVNKATQIEVVDTFSGHNAMAEIITKDSANDIAILRTSLPVNHYLPLAENPRLRKGDEIVALGYPLITIQGQEQKATFGRINALSGIQDDPRFIQMDAPIQPGNSGGPLLDFDGQVIGINTQTISALALLASSNTLPQNINYSVKIEYALPLVSRVLASYGQAVTTAGRRYSSASELVETAERAVVLIIAK